MMQLITKALWYRSVITCVLFAAYRQEELLPSCDKPIPDNSDLINGEQVPNPENSIHSPGYAGTETSGSRVFLKGFSKNYQSIDMMARSCSYATIASYKKTPLLDVSAEQFEDNCGQKRTCIAFYLAIVCF